MGIALDAVVAAGDVPRGSASTTTASGLQEIAHGLVWNAADGLSHVAYPLVDDAFKLALQLGDAGEDLLDPFLYGPAKRRHFRLSVLQLDGRYRRQWRRPCA